MKLMLSLLFFLSLFLTLGGAPAEADEVYFVQLSDTHWGFNNAAVNPDFAGTLKKAIAQVNALPGTPDFLIFSGDETHTTDSPVVRRQRMQEFRGIIAALDVRNVKFLPGEHDAALDNAQAYRESFGEPYYTFDVKGVHFVALDNVSAVNSTFGDVQLAWLKNVLSTFDPASQIMVFAHKPLLDVYAPWDWRTRDGQSALALFSRFKNVDLFCGHIHQLRRDSNGWFTQYAARGRYPARLLLPRARHRDDRGARSDDTDRVERVKGRRIRLRLRRFLRRRRRDRAGPAAQGRSNSRGYARMFRPCIPCCWFCSGDAAVRYAAEAALRSASGSLAALARAICVEDWFTELSALFSPARAAVPEPAEPDAAGADSVRSIRASVPSLDS